MKYYNDKKNSSSLQCCDVNLCMVGQCCKSFDEDFIKNFNGKGYLLEVDVQITYTS